MSPRTYGAMLRLVSDTGTAANGAVRVFVLVSLAKYW